MADDDEFDDDDLVDLASSEASSNLKYDIRKAKAAESKHVAQTDEFTVQFEARMQQRAAQTSGGAGKVTGPQAHPDLGTSAGSRQTAREATAKAAPKRAMRPGILSL